MKVIVVSLILSLFCIGFASADQLSLESKYDGYKTLLEKEHFYVTSNIDSDLYINALIELGKFDSLALILLR